VYTQGLLGCLLRFWPLGQNPAGAKIYDFHNVLDTAVLINKEIRTKMAKSANWWRLEGEGVKLRTT